MTQNEHVYCRPEVDDEVISGRNVKNVEGYIVVNFEALAVSEIFPKRLFCDGEVGVDSCNVNAICSRSEVADEVISVDMQKLSRSMSV